MNIYPISTYNYTPIFMQNNQFINFKGKHLDTSKEHYEALEREYANICERQFSPLYRKINKLKEQLEQTKDREKRKALRKTIDVLEIELDGVNDKLKRIADQRSEIEHVNGWWPI